MNIQGIDSNLAMIDNSGFKKIKENQNENFSFEELSKTEKNEKKGQNTIDNKITEMIDSIDKVKVDLEHDVTMENLRKYKEALKSFLEYYTKNELKLEQHFMRDRKGIEKRVSIIRSVDQKMNEMTENLLETNRGHLDILQKMGQIQGLLVNLYV